MKDSVVVPTRRLPASRSDTSPMQHGVIVIGAYSQLRGECRMLGVWSEPQLGTRSGLQGGSDLAEPPLMKVLQGLVLQDVYRSEKSVASKWLSSDQIENTY